MVLTSNDAEAVAAFRAEAEAQASLRDLTALFSRSMRPYGVTAYAIGVLRDEAAASTIYLSTWPRAWMELYAVNGFIHHDPVVAAALAREDVILWGPGTHTGNRVLEAAARFDFHAGWALPIHGPRAMRGVVALAGRRLLIERSDWPRLSAQSRLCYALAQRLFASERHPRHVLAPREREVLALVARGLEDAAIGEALGVTRASAHVYVERAKRRLGAATRAQAVAIATAEGLL